MGTGSNGPHYNEGTRRGTAAGRMPAAPMRTIAGLDRPGRRPPTYWLPLKVNDSRRAVMSTIGITRL